MILTLLVVLRVVGHVPSAIAVVTPFWGLTGLADLMFESSFIL